MKQSAITLQHLTVAYHNKIVLWDVNASIERGTLTAIIGPNGAGKTTLLKSIVGLIQPLAGTVQVFGKPLAIAKKEIAYIPQRALVDWDFPLHVIDLVLMGCYGSLGWFKRPGKKEYAQAEQALESVGMLAHKDCHIGQLSGGQQQRLFIARALMQDPLCYILDEPFNGIDAITEALILNLLSKLRSNGKTIIVVHHDLQTVQSYFDWALLLNTTAIACGPIESTFTQNFLEVTFSKPYRPAHVST